MAEYQLCAVVPVADKPFAVLNEQRVRRIFDHLF
jgi:hypothetical protein